MKQLIKESIDEHIKEMMNEYLKDTYGDAIQKVYNGIIKPPYYTILKYSDVWIHLNYSHKFKAVFYTNKLSKKDKVIILKEFDKADRINLELHYIENDGEDYIRKVVEKTTNRQFNNLYLLYVLDYFKTNVLRAKLFPPIFGKYGDAYKSSDFIIYFYDLLNTKK